jgi:ABC-type transport system involved in multi-copper enzyme maturation permease subunit
MNTLIKKEIRLLLPMWIVAMLLTLFPIPIWGIAGSREMFDIPIPFFAFILGLLLLGITSFGQEFASGTFTNLLSQPLERRRIWFAKTGVLAAAFALVWLVGLAFSYWQLYGSYYLHDKWLLFPSEQVIFFHTNVRQEFWAADFHAFAFLTLSCVTIFCGVLWTTLLLRHATGAFWFALLLPFIIVLVVAALLDIFNASDAVVNGATVMALVLYSGATFLSARRLFFRAQDAQWTGGEFVFSWPGQLKKEKITRVLVRPRHRFSALVWKEIQLHQANILIAGLVLILHLSAVFTLKVHPHFQGPYIADTLEAIWILWLLMPLLIGCAAVAEERKLGVIESQLCLPVGRNLQLLIKFSTALVLSVFFGMIMPLAIEGTHNFDFSDWRDLWVLSIPPAIFFIAFYASTLVRSTVHAIGLAIAISVVVSMSVALYLILGGWAWRFNEDYRMYGQMLLIGWLGIPVLWFVLVGLIFWNFKWLHENRRLWWRNASAVVVSFGIVVVAALMIFFRAWEWLEPVDYPRGPVRLSGETAVKLFISHNKMIAMLPGGALWQEHFLEQPVGQEHGGYWNIWSPFLDTQSFLGGSNWAAVAVNDNEILGIQSNGTLWKAWSPGFAQPDEVSPAQFTPIGSDTNWSRVVTAWDAFTLLKKDGTLWLWGTNTTTSPVQIGNETDWTDFLPLPGMPLAEKSDGSLWNWKRLLNGGYDYSYLHQNTNLDSDWKSFAYDFIWSAGVKTNGELWFMHDVQGSHSWEEGIPPYLEKTRLGADSQWKAVQAGYFNSIVALRDDGTLWKWTFSGPWNVAGPQSFQITQLGSRSDWIAIHSSPSWGMGIIALANDGSLWAWNEQSDHPWLVPSRRPLYLGNIFQGTSENP